MKTNYGLYMVMTNPVVGYEECARAGVRCGVPFIQLRMKEAGLTASFPRIQNEASGYGDTGSNEGRFDVNDNRSVEEFCKMLCKRELEPVFKNWDAAYGLSAK